MNVDKLQDIKEQLASVPVSPGVYLWKDAEGNVITSGGRVMALTARAPTIEEAARRAKEAAATVDFDGKYYRRDIADDVLRFAAEQEGK